MGTSAIAVGVSAAAICYRVGADRRHEAANCHSEEQQNCTRYSHEHVRFTGSRDEPMVGTDVAYSCNLPKKFNDTPSNARHDNNCAQDSGSWWHDHYLHWGL